MANARRSDGRGSGLAASARAQQGIPQQGVVPGQAGPDRQAISEIMKMLKGGNVGAERLMQLLSVLAGSTLQGMQGGAGRQERPRRQGRDQQAQAQRGARTRRGAQARGGAQASIQQLLG